MRGSIWSFVCLLWSFLCLIAFPTSIVQGRLVAFNKGSHYIGRQSAFLTPSFARRALQTLDQGAAHGTHISYAVDPQGNTALRAEHTLDGRTIKGPLKPIQDYVLIEKKDWAKESEGGVILSHQSKKEQSIGRVLSAGKGGFNPQTGARLPTEVKEGDWVIFSPYGDTFKYDNRECIVARSDLIQGVIRNSEGELIPEDVQPLHDSVFVKILKSRTKTDSGLILSAHEKSEGNTIGEVLAAGKGTQTETGSMLPMEISVGDFIQFPDYASSSAEMRINGENFAVVRQRDVMLRW